MVGCESKGTGRSHSGLRGFFPLQGRVPLRASFAPVPAKQGMAIWLLILYSHIFR